MTRAGCVYWISSLPLAQGDSLLRRPCGQLLRLVSAAGRRAPTPLSQFSWPASSRFLCGHGRCATGMYDPYFLVRDACREKPSSVPKQVVHPDAKWCSWFGKARTGGKVQLCGRRGAYAVEGAQGLSAILILHPHALHPGCDVLNSDDRTAKLDAWHIPWRENGCCRDRGFAETVSILIQILDEPDHKVVPFPDGEGPAVFVHGHEVRRYRRVAHAELKHQRALPQRSVSCRNGRAGLFGLLQDRKNCVVPSYTSPALLASI